MQSHIRNDIKITYMTVHRILATIKRMYQLIAKKTAFTATELSSEATDNTREPS